MNFNQTNLKEARKFSATLSVILLFIGLIQLFKGHFKVTLLLCSFATGFFIVGVLIARWILPFYIIFTKITHAIGWLNTRLLLCLIFYLFVTPFGLIMRIFKRDPLGKRIEKKSSTYWVKKEKNANGIMRYENQF